MFFTQEDYRKIEKWLLANSRKDTDFVGAATPLKGNETVVLVQDGKNVKTSVKDIVDQFFLLGVSDFLNITDKYGESYISLTQAIQLIPFRSRKIGQVITFIDESGNWAIYQFQGKALNQWNNTTLWIDLLAKISGIPIIDSEDITTKENGANQVSLYLADKQYNEADYSGLGRIYLRKNIQTIIDPSTGKVINVNLLTQSMLAKENTIYIIQYDYDLNNQTITIPVGCTLDFQGGSFSNGTIIGNNTKINAGLQKIFNTDIILNGTWNIAEIYPEWFGAVANNTKDSTTGIQKAIDVANAIGGGLVKLCGGVYRTTDSLYMKRGVGLQGVGESFTGKGTSINADFSNTNKWIIDVAMMDGDTPIEYADYNDIFYINTTHGEERQPYTRVGDVRIMDLCLTASNIVYGGVRLYNNLYGALQNIYIQNVHIGLAITCTWHCLLQHIYVRSTTGGFAFGPTTTTLTLIDCYHTGNRPQNTSIPTLPIVPDEIYPEYWDLDTDVKKKAFKWNFMLQQASISVYSPTVEGADLMVCDYNSKADFYNSHIELTKSLCWAFCPQTYGNDAPTVRFIGNNWVSMGNSIYNYYMFGSYRIKIICNDFIIGRCYTPNYPNNLQQSNINLLELYLFENCSNIWNLYYDDGTNLNGNYNSSVNWTKCKFKRIKLPSKVWVGRENNSGANVGSMHGNRIDVRDYMGRDDYEGTIGICDSSNMQIGSAKEYKNRNFILECLNQMMILFTNSIKLNNSKLTFQKGDLSSEDAAFLFTATSSSYTLSDIIFELKGDNVIRFADGYFQSQFLANRTTEYITINGPTKTTIFVDGSKMRYLHTGHSIDNPLKPVVTNPTTYPYTIQFRDMTTGELKEEITNMRGVTTARPTLTSANKGFEYFDETLSYPIWWNGSNWVNATGVVV